MDKATLNQYRGCLIGLAVGDILGAPFEFLSADNVDMVLNKQTLESRGFRFRDRVYPAGYYTDDTSLMICLAESLIQRGFDQDDQFLRYKSWLLNGYATPLGDTCYGIGLHTLDVLSKQTMLDVEKMDGSEEEAGGNGSIMRCAPIGLLYYCNYPEIQSKSLLSSYVTHNNLIAGWSCVVLNSIISMIIEGKNKNEILPKILALFPGAPDEIKELLALDFSRSSKYSWNVSGYSLDTLRIAIWSWQHSTSFGESIEQVIRLGDDTDTFAAVTGAITGTEYGYGAIPETWRDTIINKEWILSLADSLYANTIDTQ